MNGLGRNHRCSLGYRSCCHILGCDGRCRTIGYRCMMMGGSAVTVVGFGSRATRRRRGTCIRHCFVMMMIHGFQYPFLCIRQGHGPLHMFRMQQSVTNLCPHINPGQIGIVVVVVMGTHHNITLVRWWRRWCVRVRRPRVRKGGCHHRCGGPRGGTSRHTIVIMVVAKCRVIATTFQYFCRIVIGLYNHRSTSTTTATIPTRSSRGRTELLLDGPTVLHCGPVSGRARTVPRSGRMIGPSWCCCCCCRCAVSS